MNKDLSWIKKHYGERFSHLCRELFSTLLDTEGLLPDLLDNEFAHNKYLYDDLIKYNLKYEFKDYIYDLLDDEENNVIETEDDPETLLSKVGYDLYECKSEKDIQSFRKYYAPKEELCTFKGGRLNDCYVFFAVKKNVDEIRREDFPNPKRQDLYGTSVISIQFVKGMGTNNISIKNRYNHTVNNPDSTFSNNLDNIIPGLSASFKKKYDFKFKIQNDDYFEIPDYIEAADGKYYKYNYEVDNVYYCPDNIVIKNLKAKKLDSRFIVMDYFILDLKEKEIITMDENDSFIKSVTDCGKIEKINYFKDKDGSKIINLYMKKLEEPIIIKIDKFGRITEYINKYIKRMGDYFLSNNIVLEKIELPNVVSIGRDFLSSNNSIKKVNFPNVLKIGDDFLYFFASDDISLPKVKIIGNYFLCRNELLKKIELPNLVYVGDDFMRENTILQEIYLPCVKEMGKSFLKKNVALEKIELPKVISIGNDFMSENELLREISLPNVNTIGDSFLLINQELRSIFLPKVRYIGSDFICTNEKIEEIFMPKLKSTHYSDEDFMPYNNSLKKLKVSYKMLSHFLHMSPSNCVEAAGKHKQLSIGRR